MTMRLEPVHFIGPFASPDTVLKITESSRGTQRKVSLYWVAQCYYFPPVLIGGIGQMPTSTRLQGPDSRSWKPMQAEPQGRLREARDEAIDRHWKSWLGTRSKKETR